MSDTLKWQKSSYSTAQTNCVEVARNLPGTVAIRDSKDPDGPKLHFGNAAWRQFTAAVKEG